MDFRRPFHSIVGAIIVFAMAERIAYCFMIVGMTVFVTSDFGDYMFGD